MVFDDVRLMSLLVHDIAEARRFVVDELGELAADTAHNADLRKTAASYLRLKRSPMAVAGEMYVVRNTVSYRLKKAEELLGHSLDDRTLETWVALVLMEAMGADQDGEAPAVKRMR
ncbi:helix-turn-helix domain-containing protein [Nocardia sp. NPDC004123]